MDCAETISEVETYTNGSRQYDLYFSADILCLKSIARKLLVIYLDFVHLSGWDLKLKIKNYKNQ